MNRAQIVFVVLFGGFLFSQTFVSTRAVRVGSTFLDARDATCPNSAPFLYVPVAVPPGTAGITRTRLQCVALDPAVFAVRNGVLTVNFPVPTFAHSVELIGPVDGTNLNFVVPPPGPVASEMVGVFLKPTSASYMAPTDWQFLTAGVDFTMTGLSINFLSPNRAPRVGDTVLVVYGGMLQ